MSKVDSVLDALTRFVQVVGHDPALKEWFDALAQMQALQRRNAILTMTEQMKSRGEDADLVVSFRLLADPRIFEAACHALEEGDF